MRERQKNHSHEALSQALGCSEVPAVLTRQGRVKLLGEAFQALLDGKLPSREAALFLGGAGMAWLTQGGSLERDFLKITKARSHRTPTAIWQEMAAQREELHEEANL